MKGINVNISERKVEHQVYFWSILGPCLILLSLVVLLFKSSSHWYFPLSAIVAIPICLKWKMKGLAATMAIFFSFAVLFYQHFNLEERYWYVGMAMAMAFSLIILVLALDEISFLIQRLQSESQSRLDNFSRLSEQIKTTEAEWLKEKEHLNSRAHVLSAELVQAQDERKLAQKLVNLTQEELVALRDQHTHLLQDLFERKQHIAQLKEQIEETEATVQGLVNGEMERQLQTALERVEQSEKHIESLKQEKEALLHAQKQIEDRAERIAKELEQALMREHQEQQQVRTLEQDKMHCYQQRQQQEETIKALEEEKRQLNVILNEFKQDYQQMEGLAAHYQAELEQQKQVATQFENQLEEQRQNCDTLKEQREKADHLVKQHQQNIEQLSQQLVQAQQQRVLIDQELVQLKIEVNEKEARLKEWQDRSQDQQAEAADKAVYEKELEQLKVDLLAKQQQVDDLQKSLEKMQDQASRLPYAPGNNRRIEGMYIQLKEQFQEKSSVLDETRRDLFYAQEEIEKIRKEQEETSIFQFSEGEKLWQNYVQQLQKETEETLQEQQQEIQDLYILVQDLLKQIH